MNVAYRTPVQRWQAVVARDQQARAHFCYAVATTGVYCRPGCPSRLPRRCNVSFFASGKEAERAGFRACRKCSPDRAADPAPHRAAIVAACRTLEQSETPPSLAELATAAGRSPHRFQRLFKSCTGVTPKAYAVNLRRRRLQEQLRGGDPATEALYAAEFGSGSHLYAQAGKTLGVSPSRFRDGAAGEDVAFAVAPCALGWVLAAATSRGLRRVALGDAREILVEQLVWDFPAARLSGNETSENAWLARVVAVVEGSAPAGDLPLDIRGTAFQRRVWSALQEIPAGSTTTYGALARHLGHPTAARAVAGACAANPLAVVVPCHRVLATDGSPADYRWGLARKRSLLDREAGSGERSEQGALS